MRFALVTSLLTLALVLAGCRDDPPRMTGDSGADTSITPDTGTSDSRPPTDGGDCTPTADQEAGDLCGNSLDDDCDGFPDCMDFSCVGATGCPPSESSNPLCNDGLDNDGDGFTDCDDNSCQERIVCTGEGTTARCDDGMDNDDDGDIDCDDSDCMRENVAVCGGVADGCSDGIDNDGDSFTDCNDNDCLVADPSCMAPAIEQSNATCSDGMDNDGDGDTDCDDSRCQEEGIVVCDGTPPVAVDPGDYTSLADAECSDSVNNDGDVDSMGMPRTDCGDFGCSQNPDVTVCPGENTNALCSDGMDNDGNTFADCRDFSCSQNPFVTVCETGFERCSDGIDNDGNGFADCDDFSCTPRMGVSAACF